MLLLQMLFALISAFYSTLISTFSIFLADIVNFFVRGCFITLSFCLINLVITVIDLSLCLLVAADNLFVRYSIDKLTY